MIFSSFASQRIFFPLCIEIRQRCPGIAELCPTSTGVIVAWRGLMQSRKVCWGSDEGDRLALSSSRGRYLPDFHAGFEASNPPPSTQTHPSVPIHFTPV